MKSQGKNELPWSRSSDRLPPEPTAGSKTLLSAPLLGSQPRQSLSVNKDTFGLNSNFRKLESSKESKVKTENCDGILEVLKYIRLTSAVGG